MESMFFFIVARSAQFGRTPQKTAEAFYLFCLELFQSGASQDGCVRILDPEISAALLVEQRAGEAHLLCAALIIEITKWHFH